jgi:hypothetical protein
MDDALDASMNRLDRPLVDYAPIGELRGRWFNLIGEIRASSPPAIARARQACPCG